MSKLNVVVRPVALFLAIWALGALAQPAAANITSLSGAISETTPHPTGTLDSNTIESDTTAYVWFEQKVTLASPLTMDHVGIGTVNSTGSANSQQVSPGFALSYVVHFDQDNTTGANGVTLTEIEIEFERILVNPEPGTAALLGLGLVGLTGIVIRRRRARRRRA